MQLGLVSKNDDFAENVTLLSCPEPYKTLTLRRSLVYNIECEKLFPTRIIFC